MAKNYFNRYVWLFDTIRQAGHITPTDISQKWLTPIVNAMKDGKAIGMTYQSFNRPEPNAFIAHPYCLKLFRRRWYVLVKSEQYAAPRIYALDRVLNVEQSSKG